MAPSPPLNLSAEAINSTTAILLWSPPANTGTTPLTGYNIERNLNGGGFVPLVSLGVVLTYTDTTLSARDNAVYRVNAQNSTGTSGFSDTASTTTSTSEAQTIKELLFNNWSLTGELSKTVIPGPPPMDEVVMFYDRGQIPGNKVAKAVTVQKINALGNENIIEHPRFLEQSETFEITCFLQVPDGADDQFSVWVDLMQQMTSEVTRILKTVYSPSAKTGQFFQTNTNWTKDDTFFPDDPILVRTLRFVFTRIISNDPEVFVGYPGALGTAGVLVFSRAASSGDNLPQINYTYTTTERIEVNYGWRNIPYLTADGTATTGVPIYYRGQFSGQFSCDMYLKKDDFTASTLNSLAFIGLPQANKELGTAAFLVNSANTETPVAVLTQTVPVNITSLERVSENQELVKIAIRGNLVNPSTYILETNLITMIYEDGTTDNMSMSVAGNKMGYEIPTGEDMAYETNPA